MGKQVEFYMSPGDEAELFEAIRSKFGPACIVKTLSKSKLEIIEQFPADYGGTSDFSIVRAQDIGDVVFRMTPDEGMLLINKNESKVVEFARCAPIDDWLSAGRFWFEENARSGKKSEDFRKWANQILAWIKRSWKRSDEGFYIAPIAEKLSSEGKVMLGPHRPRVHVEEMRKRLGII